MPKKRDVKKIVSRVEALLAGERNVRLRIAGSKFNDQWLYVVVEPARPGERASEYARMMTTVERTLLKEGFDQVLLIPALPEHAGIV